MPTILSIFGGRRPSPCRKAAFWRSLARAVSQILHTHLLARHFWCQGAILESVGGKPTPLAVSGRTLGGQLLSLGLTYHTYEQAWRHFLRLEPTLDEEEAAQDARDEERWRPYFARRAEEAARRERVSQAVTTYEGLRGASEATGAELLEALRRHCEAKDPHVVAVWAKGEPDWGDAESEEGGLTRVAFPIGRNVGRLRVLESGLAALNSKEDRGLYFRAEGEGRSRSRRFVGPILRCQVPTDAQLAESPDPQRELATLWVRKENRALADTKATVLATAGYADASSKSKWYRDGVTVCRPLAPTFACSQCHAKFANPLRRRLHSCLGAPAEGAC